jgi:hypothetical protein
VGGGSYGAAAHLQLAPQQGLALVRPSPLLRQECLVPAESMARDDKTDELR